jgi:hypothetical protein
VPRLEQWELLGLLLSVGAALFGLVYVAPALVTLTVSFRGVAGFSASIQASVGLAGLALTALGSLGAMVIGQFKPAGAGLGGSIIIWTNFVVLALADMVFYLGETEDTVVLLFGAASAFLTIVGLLVISRRTLALPPASGS